MTLSPKLVVTPGLEVATVAGGCFWGVDHIYRKYFGNGKGLVDCRVGYANGNTASPTYQQVCSGRTNHAEALQILFDPKKLSYAHLIEFFLRTHDPTQRGHQGPDIGSQYRTAIFTHDEQQNKIAHEVVEKVNEKYFPNSKIVTEIEPIRNFWDGEDYHQNYLNNNPGGYECPTHYLRGKFGEWCT